MFGKILVLINAVMMAGTALSYVFAPEMALDLFFAGNPPSGLVRRQMNLMVASVGATMLGQAIFFFYACTQGHHFQHLLQILLVLHFLTLEWVVYAMNNTTELGWNEGLESLLVCTHATFFVLYVLCVAVTPVSTEKAESTSLSKVFLGLTAACLLTFSSMSALSPSDYIQNFISNEYMTEIDIRQITHLVLAQAVWQFSWVLIAAYVWRVLPNRSMLGLFTFMWLYGVGFSGYVLSEPYGKYSLNRDGMLPGLVMCCVLSLVGLFAVFQGPSQVAYQELPDV